MNYSKLKEAVKCSRLQRKEIALRAAVTPKTIDNILAGSDLKVSTLEAICKAIGIDAGVLFATPTIVHTEGAYSPASESGDVSVVVGDALMAERVRSLEALLAEKDARIDELKERINELKKGE